MKKNEEFFSSAHFAGAATATNETVLLNKDIQNLTT
jgi:hypothetical protein